VFTMKISTTLSLFAYDAEKQLRPVSEMIYSAAKAGFSVVDMPLSTTFPFMLPGVDFKPEMDAAKKAAVDCGVRIRYAHLPFNFPDLANDTPETWQAYSEGVMKAIDVAAYLGVETAAVHAHAVPQPNYDYDARLEHCVTRLRPFVTRAREVGLKLAVENMCDRAMVHIRRFCATPEELLAVVESLGSDVGVCWDTGHANLCALNQYAALKKIGARLKMVHINDNDGLDDDHVPPFLGKVNWDDVLRGLKDGGYQGDFNYEVKSNAIPFGPTKDAYIHYLVEMANEFVARING